MDYSRDARMGLGTDGMGWLPGAMLSDLPQPPPWGEWPESRGWSAPGGTVPVWTAPAPLPTQQARKAMAPWANRLDLPGLGV